ncbi:MAG: hypothetical protein V3S24_19045 [Candidatus Tectomicrobia bacterium]
MESRLKSTKLHTLRRHLERLERRLQRLEALSQRHTRIRVWIVLLGIATAMLVSRVLGDSAGGITAIIAVSLFVIVALSHGRVKTSISRHKLWHHIKATHVARMALDWTQIPLPPMTPLAAGHPFETDLNLTGERSLHHLIDTTRSQEGSARLRHWLLYPITEPAQVRTRQDLIRELIPLVMFRDRLTLHSALVAQDSHTHWEGEALRRWLEQPTHHASLMPWLIGLGTLAGATIVLAICYALSMLPGWWIATFLVYLVVYTIKHRDLDFLFDEAFQLETTLDHFRAVLLYLETYTYPRTPHLANLCAPFRQAGQRPSVALKKIARIAGAASIQKGNIVGPMVNAIVPWDLYFAHRFAQCKDDVRTSLPVWLDTWYELEALNALAHYGYLNPDHVFADVCDLTESDRQPVFRARHLGHPLLPDAARVCNDLTLEHLGEIVLVTGSNMSGKSTFLRTLGINLCLAFNGAPVNAVSLQTVPFRLFTCITVSDSVTDGISYFYAEVQRLKALLDALQETHPFPLFFLIDEIFRGTNNRERLIGSRAYVQALAGGRGVGVVSTHDLELIKLADGVEGIRNAHFREDIMEGRMIFDYKLRQGPCPTTNALRIMHMEGLPVAPDDD